MPTDNSKKPNQSELAATKQKKQIRIVAILVLGLILALVMQPSGDSGPNAESVTATTISLKQNSPHSDDEFEVPYFIKTQKLPMQSIEEIASIDLFKNPYSPPKVIEKDTEKVQTSNLRTQAIYGPSGSDQHAAWVDTKVIQTNTHLPNGKRAIKIDSDGVHFE